MTKEEKEKLISKEKKKLNELFKNIDKNKKTLINSLISQAAFLSVTISILENEINEQGLLEIFENGKQCFQRENSSTKTIIAFQKNYLAIMKQLLEHLPDDTQNDALDDFLNK
jgi:hypothetical protein